MSRCLLAFMLVIVSLSSLFAQPKLVKSTLSVWDSGEERWKPNRVGTWEYDSQNREVAYLNANYGASDTAITFDFINHTFDKNGNLSKRVEGHSFFGSEILNQNEYFYDDQQRLIESRNGSKRVQEDTFRIERIYAHTYDENARIHSVEEIIPYIGNPTRHKQTDSVFYTDGRIQEVTIHAYENSPPVIRLSRRYSYQYLNGGSQTEVTYEVAYPNQTGWVLIDRRLTTYDEKRLRKEYKYMEFFPSGLINVFINTYTYDEEGRLLTDHYVINEKPRNIDSTVYEIDPLRQVKTKTKYSFDLLRGGGIPVVQTHHYTYYCDGMVETEIGDQLPSVYRTKFEYDDRGECLLDESSEAIIIYPNPNAGIFEIESKLLVGSQAIVRIFSATGQEVYHEALPKTTEHKTIDIREFPTGNYYLFIQNGAFSASKRILILE